MNTESQGAVRDVPAVDNKKGAARKMARIGQAAQQNSRKSGGFTLTEIIAVLAIIAILATAVIAVGRYAVRRARVGKAKATLEKLTLAIELYKQHFAMYIPESIHTANGDSLTYVLSRLSWPAGYKDALGRTRQKPSENDYDKPSEILFFFLQDMYDAMSFSSGSRQANIGLLASLVRTKAFVKFKGNELRDTDGDKLPEVVDGWGVPFLYVAADRMPGDSGLNIEPHQDKNPESFSLYSFGPDKLGYYDGVRRGEHDYPVGDLDFNGDSDSHDETEMTRRITDFAQREGYSRDKATTMANKDNLTNWERER
jgi:prepilin-type N-terminal cleavage/methylation domain-containing protein